MPTADELSQSLNEATIDAISKGIGTVQIWAGAQDELPKGWFLCNGQELDYRNKDYLPLYLVIGTRYGIGSHSSGFKIPNLSKKIVIGADTDYPVGKTIGQDVHSVTIKPILKTQIMYDALAPNTENGFETHPVIESDPQTISFDVRQASIAMSYIIKYQ